MYARTALLTFVLLATGAPSVFAAPTPAGLEPSQLARRDYLDLLTRQVADLQARENSGALSWQSVYDWGNSALDKLQGLTPTIKTGAEIYKAANANSAHDAVARDVEAARAFKREELTRDLHLITRAILEERDVDQSGAIDWQDVKDFGKGFVDGFTKTVSTALPIVGAFVKREDLDIFARELASTVAARATRDAESGAIDWQDVKDFGKGFVDGFTKTVSTALPLVGAFVRRDEYDTIARQLTGALQKGGLPIVSMSAIPMIAGGIKREDLTRDLHMIARSVVEARDVDQSGALDWQDVKDFGKGFVDGFTKTVSTALPIVSAFVKREDLDIIARHLVDGVVARAVQDAESGAIDWQDVKDFGKGFVDGFTKTVSTALPIVSAFVKREELEMIARELDARMVLPGRSAGTRPISSAFTMGA